MPLVTSLYAALLGLMSLAIGFRAGSLRGKLNIPVGDGGNSEMLLAMRRHANFAEWVPLALLLIALLEMDGVARNVIHALGAALVITRACHALGVRGDTMKGLGRLVGAMGTAILVLVVSVWLLVRFFAG